MSERLTDERVREFAAWVLGQHTGTIEGCDIEEKAVALGLMEAVEVTERCGEEGACECAMTDNLPGLCYRSRLAARRTDATAALTDEEREALAPIATRLFVAGLDPAEFVAEVTRQAIAAVPRLAARAGDREEREELHRIESVRWSRSNDEEIEGNVYGEPVTLLIVKGHVGPLGWDDAVRVVRSAPGGETRAEG